MKPRLAVPRKWNGHPQPAHHREVNGVWGASPRLRGAPGASPGLPGFGGASRQDSNEPGSEAAPAGDRRCGSAEFGRRGRARGSHRLQKSTGGARPISPMREERVDYEVRSSLEARERRQGERASEAGSSAAKRRERWRALHLSEMGRAKALSREHLSMEGASDRTKSLALTRERWKAVLVSEVSG